MARNYETIYTHSSKAIKVHNFSSKDTLTQISLILRTFLFLLQSFYTLMREIVKKGVTNGGQPLQMDRAQIFFRK